MKKVIYCFWTGTNPMSANRQRCLEQLRETVGVDVELVTPENLSMYIREPLHPAYAHLSATHKADYLRMYFMHFYGGGYSDIKQTTGSWSSSFDELESSDAFCIGYPEIPGGTASTVPPETWVHLIGNCAYICKPGTPFTKEWYDGLIEKMEAKSTLLSTFPAMGPRDCMENQLGYPLRWTELLGNIFHPLVLRYRTYMRRSLPPSVFHTYM